MSSSRPRHVSRVEFLGSFPKQVPEVGLPEVAFAGRSNVGKSSAINTLLGRKAIARVSRTPGRTQAINLFRVNERLSFADLPGYGFARVPEAVQAAWKALVEGYLGDRELLRLVVVLVDSRRDPQDLDLALIQGLQDAGIPLLVVATKVDKLARSRRRSILHTLRQGLGVDALLPFSARSREGVAQVWQRIDAACAGPLPRQGARRRSADQ